MKNTSADVKQHLMDIDLLSKMVKELILDNDRVVLPGLGCFVAEMVPSTFSDKGYTINPPYRRLYFRSRPDQGDELAKLYAKGNHIEMEIADKIINDFVSELKSVLFSKKTIVVPGLGRLRATKENAVFFVADEDLDIYPAGFGLEPISLKTHQESASEVTAAVEGLRQILGDTTPTPEPTPEQAPEPTPEPTPEPVVEVEPAEESAPIVEPEPVPELDPESIFDPESISEPEPEPVVEIAEEPAGKPVAKKVLVTLLVIILVIALLLGAYIAIARFAPDFLDQFLYTKEELEILNYRP